MLHQRYRQPVHPSWLIAAVCLGITVGLIVSQIIRLPIASLEWFISALLLLVFSFAKKKVYVVPVLLLAGIIIGTLRGNAYQALLAPYAGIIGKSVTVQGVVSDDSDTGKSGEIVLRLKGIRLEDHSLAGAIWLTTKGEVAIKRGDIVTVKGKLSEGFGSFAASMYRVELIRVERPVPGSPALTLRDWFADAVRRAIPEPEASLGVGYVVGQRRSLPDELDTALRTVGLTHVVVASGYNLTILVNVARRLFAKVSKFLAAFTSGGLTIAFIAVTGLSPSMSRAGLVTGLGLLAWYYGRKFHPVVLLLLAAAVTLLLNPSYAQGDLGWQLSFASFAGVLIVAPLLQSYFFGEQKPGVIRQVFFETLSAWVCTVPLIVLAFGQFSNVAILANLLVLPLIPLAMLLTFIAGGVTLLVPALAGVVGFPATLLLGYMTKVAIYLGNVPWAQTTLEITPATLLVYYVALIAFCGYIWRKTQFNFIKQTAE